MPHGAFKKYNWEQAMDTLPSCNGTLSDAVDYFFRRWICPSSRNSRQSRLMDLMNRTVGCQLCPSGPKTLGGDNQYYIMSTLYIHIGSPGGNDGSELGLAMIMAMKCLDDVTTLSVNRGVGWLRSDVHLLRGKFGWVVTCLAWWHYKLRKIGCLYILTLAKMRVLMKDHAGLSIRDPWQHVIGRISVYGTHDSIKTEEVQAMTMCMSWK